VVVSPVLTALRAVDPNGLSPRDALDLVFHLRELDRDPGYPAATELRGKR
jgi:hypothetical protein